MGAPAAGQPVTPDEPTYPDAPEALIARWQQRRAPLWFRPGEALPPPDVDLRALAASPLAPAPPDVARPASAYTLKRHALLGDLAGGTELMLLHGVLIACLRKRDWPAHAPALFRRLWREEPAHLMAGLSTRWLISAAITFADHGETEGQRRLGQSLNLLFSLMKLYEFERLHSGLAPDRAYPAGSKAKATLPMGMTGFSLGSGGLDINLLAPIWAEAQADTLLGPLACHLLDRLNHDPGTLFRRLGTMRARAERKRSRNAGPPPDPDLDPGEELR